MKKNAINYLVIFIITVIVLYFSLKDNYLEIMRTIGNINLYLFVLSIVVYFLYIFLKSIVMKIIIQNFKKDYKQSTAFRMGLETNFFHAITPFSTGGQPYEVYRLKKDGVSIINGANASIQNFIIYQTALVLLGIFALVYNYYQKLFLETPVLSSLVTLGFMINFLVIVFLFIIALFKKLDKIVVNFFITILSKLKIVKNPQEKKEQFEKYLSDFNEGAKILLKNKGKFIFLVLIELLALILLYSVPYFLIKGLGLEYHISLLNVVVASAYVMLIGSFVPIPGGTGGLEYGFIVFYGNFIAGPILNAVMLTWRFVTYYLGMIVGSIVLSFRKKD